jgi:hypothetical protein
LLRQRQIAARRIRPIPTPFGDLFDDLFNYL